MKKKQNIFFFFTEYVHFSTQLNDSSLCNISITSDHDICCVILEVKKEKKYWIILLK